MSVLQAAPRSPMQPHAAPCSSCTAAGRAALHEGTAGTARIKWKWTPRPVPGREMFIHSLFLALQHFRSLSLFPSGSQGFWARLGLGEVSGFTPKPMALDTPAVFAPPLLPDSGFVPCVWFWIPLPYDIPYFHTTQHHIFKWNQVFCHSLVSRAVPNVKSLCKVTEAAVFQGLGCRRWHCQSQDCFNRAQAQLYLF